MKKVGIYQRTPDGQGEELFFIASIACILSENHDVELFHHNENLDLKKFEAEWGLNLSRVATSFVPEPQRDAWSMGTWGNLRRESDFCKEWSAPQDIFLYAGSVPPLFNHAKHGVLLTQFPKIDFDEFYARKSPEWKKMGAFRRFWQKRYQATEWSARFGSYQTCLCNSKFTQRWCMSRWHLNAQVLNPPLPMEGVPNKNENLIVASGTFTRKNAARHDLLISAFQDFYDKMMSRFNLASDWKLRLVGRCGELPEDLEFVEKLKKKSYGYPIEIVTNGDRKMLWDALAQAVFYWSAVGFDDKEEKHPEFMESFGLTALEAQSAGAIPMVYQAGGLPEVIHHGMNGFLWGSFRELVETTTAILLESRILPILRAGATQNAEKYVQSRFRQNLKKVLRGVTEVIE